MGVPAYGAQRELLLLSEADAAGVPHTNPMPRAWLLWSIHGELDQARFVAALRRAAAGYDIWSSRFAASPDGPLLVADPRPQLLPVTVADGDPAAALSAAVYAPMDLRHDPLARACLVRMGPFEHALTIVADHGYADGSTLTGLVRRTALAYRRPDRVLSAIPPFLDFAAAAVRDARRPASREFWAAAMARPVPEVSFPGGRWKPWWECNATGAQPMHLAEPDLAALRTALARTGASTPGLLLAALEFIATLWTDAPVPILYARAGRSSRDSLAVPGPLHEAVLSVPPNGRPQSLAGWVRGHADVNAAAPPLFGQWLTDFGGVPALRERRRFVLNVQAPLRTFTLDTAQLGPADPALAAAVRPPASHPGFPARNALHLAVRTAPKSTSVTIHHDPEVVPHAEPVAAAVRAFLRLLADEPDVPWERAADLIRAEWLAAARISSVGA